jgi:hypothetical protein
MFDPSDPVAMMFDPVDTFVLFDPLDAIMMFDPVDTFVLFVSLGAIVMFFGELMFFGLSDTAHA